MAGMLLTRAEEIAVLDILRKDYKAENIHAKEEHSDLVASIIDAVEKGSIVIELSEKSKGKSYSQALEAMMKGEIAPDQLGFIGPKEKISIDVVSRTEEAESRISMELSIKDLQLIVATGHKLINKDLADIASHLSDKTLPLHITKTGEAAYAAELVTSPATSMVRVPEAAHLGRVSGGPEQALGA